MRRLGKFDLLLSQLSLSYAARYIARKLWFGHVSAAWLFHASYVGADFVRTPIHFWFLSLLIQILFPTAVITALSFLSRNYNTSPPLEPSKKIERMNEIGNCLFVDDFLIFIIFPPTYRTDIVLRSKMCYRIPLFSTWSKKMRLKSNDFPFVALCLMFFLVVLESSSKNPRVTADCEEPRLTGAIRSFPDEVQLCVSSIPGASYGVCAKEHIPLGTWIGPYEGKRITPQRLTPQIDSEHLWEVELILYLYFCFFFFLIPSWT